MLKIKRMKTKTKNREEGGTLTPELVVVAAALGLAAAVSRLADVALVVHAVTVQKALRETSRGTLQGMYLEHLRFQRSETPRGATPTKTKKTKTIT